MERHPDSVASSGYSSSVPRWNLSGTRGYGAEFARLVDSGVDIDGEARLADCLVPRGAQILDAGSGMGRVGAALQRRGHRAIGVDMDTALLAQSRRTYPDFPVREGRLEDLGQQWCAERGIATPFDLIVCVGNVLIFLAPETEGTVLERFASLLGSTGRVLVGFETASDKAGARAYPASEFADDAARAGLEIQQWYSTYELAPMSPDAGYVVAILAPSS